ncbi:ComF family protein [Parapedobacter tibetensis]|uniref:ComF family protein n=1 Tax=Parapedobacter tibetensis TaxID=2972951 RepID=UPI00214DA6A4|nr:hypothetical protein [Parapedobacter tibetensis]
MLSKYRGQLRVWAVGEPLAVNLFQRVGNPEEKIGLERGDILVRALGHPETAVLFKADPKPLDLLCVAIASKVGCGFLPDLLQKKRNTTKLTGLNRFERERELENVYKLGNVFGWGKKRVWIIDDVVTTGATIRAVATVLKKRYASVEIYAFCLARTDANPFGSDPILLGHDYIWDQQGSWMLRESWADYMDDFLPRHNNLSSSVFKNEGAFLINR